LGIENRKPKIVNFKFVQASNNYRKNKILNSKKFKNTQYDNPVARGRGVGDGERIGADRGSMAST
jgi:hypothetical protein